MIRTLHPSRAPLFCLVLCQIFTTLQAYGRFTTVLNIPPDPDIGHSGRIGSDTQLNLAEGGAVGSHFRAGASDGTSTNVEVNISGGTVGNNFYAYNGSTVNISGGTVANRFYAFDGSTVNISGGSVGKRFGAHFGSTVNLSGGSVGDFFRAKTGSTLNISGGEFRLDGVLIGGLDTVGNSLLFNLPIGSMLSGTLANGDTFAFTSLDRDEINDGTLTLSASTLPPLGPAVIVLPVDPVPLGVRGGQTLVVLDSGTVGNNFNAGLGSTVVVTGGQAGNNFEAVGAQVRIASGSVGDYFDAFSGSEVTISGGSVGHSFDAHNGSTVNISGGSVGSYFSAYPGSIVNLSGGSTGRRFRAARGSTVNISGGSFGYSFRAGSGSTVNISGGMFDPRFEVGSYARAGIVMNISGGTFGYGFKVGSHASAGIVMNISGGTFGPGFEIGEHARSNADIVVNISGGTFGDNFDVFEKGEVNLFGTEFVVGTSNITDLLTPGIPFTITNRRGTLSGLLADGSPFSFDLNSTNIRGEDYFDRLATLTVSLALPGLFDGDADGDGDVDGLDFLAWQRGHSPDPLSSADLAAWEANYGTNSAPFSSEAATVPEPSCLLLLATAIVALFLRT